MNQTSPQSTPSKQHSFADFPFTINVHEHPLDYNAGILYKISGDNGAGKTSFIERILIPQLENTNICTLYLGSDKELVSITIRSWLRLNTSAWRGFPTRSPASLLHDQLGEGELRALFEAKQFGAVIIDEYASDVAAILSVIPETAIANAICVISTHQHAELANIYKLYWHSQHEIHICCNRTMNSIHVNKVSNT